MTSPASDDKMSAEIAELEQRAEWLLENRGKSDGHGLRYWRGDHALVMRDTSYVLTINLSELSIGEVFRRTSARARPMVIYTLVPQALYRLRQVMVLDDLSKI